MNRRTLVMVLAFMAAGFATVSTAEAGGGGGKAKKNVIFVVNQQVDTPPALATQFVIWLPNGQNPTNQLLVNNAVAFAAKGGKPLTVAGNVIFPNVAPGSGAVWVLDSFYNVTGSAPYTVKSGSQLAYTVTGGDGTGLIRQLP